MTRREQIRSAYKLTGRNAGFYDGMMTCSTIPGNDRSAPRRIKVSGFFIYSGLTWCQ